jgi:hypothetical protein
MKSCALLGTAAALLTAAGAGRAEASSSGPSTGPTVVFQQTNIQIAFQHVYQPVFVFLWNTGPATIAIAFAPVTQTNTQNAVNVITIGNYNNIGNNH